MNETSDIPLQFLTGDCEYNIVTEEVPMHVKEDETMTATSIGFLLEEIFKMKSELHDPRHRRNKFFPEIRERLIKERGLCFSAKTLEKKFLNLKKHFDTLCHNSNNSDGCRKKPITWLFFDKMMDIFAEELAIEDAPTMASLYPELPLPKTALPIKAQPPKKIKQEEMQFESIEEDSDTDSDPESSSQTKWNHDIILDFLNECMEKKEEFWTSRVSRRKIFTEIRSRMKAKGYVFRVDTLDLKLRNMRIRYKIIEKMLQENGGVKKNRNNRFWPYFDQMHFIYDGYEERATRRKPGRARGSKILDDELELLNQNVQLNSPLKFDQQINKFDPCLSTKNADEERQLINEKDEHRPLIEFDKEPTTTSMKFRQILPKPRPFEEIQPPEHNVEPSFEIEKKLKKALPVNTDKSKTPERFQPSPGFLDSFFIEDESIDEDDKSLSATQKIIENPLVDVGDDLVFAKEILALEERRTVATEKLFEQLKESNRIREKKLKFNRTKLAYLKNKAKRKHLSSKI